MNLLTFGSPADLFIFVFGSVGHVVSTIKGSSCLLYNGARNEERYAQL